MLSKTKDPPKIEVKIITRYDDQIPDFYRTFRCNSRNVREALASEVDHFTSRDPTLIVAPTGSHKTTFALLEIVSRAIKSGKNVLIILNRVALATQLKQRVMEAIDSPLLGCLTNKGIQETEHFGCVCVITYHRLPAFVNDPANKEWIKNLMYVVADEVHFLAADSSFNEKCGYYLKLLTLKFQHAIRVYMTATEWDILVPLAEAEQANYLDTMKLVYPWLLPREFRRYVFPADYSHVNLHFFGNLDEIRARIEANPNEKWILFMDSKAAGKALAKELGGKAIYLDADSKETEAWYQLLKDNKFQTQVLITTAVLDCGVNVIDPKLCNVVIFTDDRTRLIQMLGRKRCSQGEGVNLYVYDMDDKTLAKRQRDCESLSQWLDRYTEATWEGRRKMATEIWHHPDDQLRHYFNFANGYLVPNDIAFYALRRRLHFYTALLNGEFTFQQAVREWLGLQDEGAVVEENADPEQKLRSFCENHLNQDLSEEEIAKFRELVIAIADRIGIIKTRTDRLESIGRDALNKRMETFAFPYRLVRNAWRIIKYQEE